MKKENLEYIGYENHELCVNVFYECLKRGIVKPVGSRGGKCRPHPINHMNVVLNALDRDEKRFEKHFIMCCGGKGDSEHLVRMFKLKSWVKK